MPELTFPCMNVKLVPTAKVEANDYNPNFVAYPEMELLQISIERDGLTQPVVVFYDSSRDRYTMVDGFHRFQIVRDHFKSDVIPVVVIDKPLGERMASTIRHNRARGKHQVDLQAELVKKMLKLEWDDGRIAEALGMTAEELLRMKQQVRVAAVMANAHYTQSWKVVETGSNGNG